VVVCWDDITIAVILNTEGIEDLLAHGVQLIKTVMYFCRSDEIKKPWSDFSDEY